MHTRVGLGFKGPVWKVALERIHPDAIGEVYTCQFEFDGEGRLVRPARAVRVEDRGGQRVEIQNVTGVDGWVPEGLDDVGLATGGAAIVETSFTPEGYPSLSIFKDERGVEILRAPYVCDGQGRIVELSQYIGNAVPLTSKSHPDVVILETGTELSQLTLRYDDSGHVLEQTLSFLGKIQRHTTHAYNDKGDKTLTETDGEGPAVYEYEYDRWLNWTRQVIRHPLAVTETRRLITYYE